LEDLAPARSERDGCVGFDCLLRSVKHVSVSNIPGKKENLLKVRPRYIRYLQCDIENGRVFNLL